MEILIWTGSALAVFVLMQLLLGKTRPDRRDKHGSHKSAGHHQAHADAEPESAAGSITVPCGPDIRAEAGQVTLSRDDVELALRLEGQGQSTVLVLDAQERELAAIAEDSPYYAKALGWLGSIFGETLDIAIPDYSPDIRKATLLWRKNPAQKTVNARLDDIMTPEETAKLLSHGFMAWPGARFERTAYITPVTLPWNVSVEELTRLGVLEHARAGLVTACPVQVGTLALDKGASCAQTESSATNGLGKLELQLHMQTRADLALKQLQAELDGWRKLAPQAPEFAAELNPVSRRINFSVRL